MPDGAPPRKGLLRDISATAVAGGFLAVLVSYAGPLLIYLQAADGMNVSSAVFASWTFAISMAAGISSIVLSLALRMPIAMAWSAPGTVLLISLGMNFPLSDVIGTYLAVACVLAVLGVSGLFERLIGFLHPAITNGLMAGILCSFGLKAAASLATDPGIFAVLVAAFAVLAAIAPRYAVICLLALAMTLAATVYGADVGQARLAIVAPVFTAPSFSLAAMLGLGLPLLITTLGGQFLPGMAILRSNGFDAPARPILVAAGAASALSALFGGVTTALAAITAAFCAGPDSHQDKDRRYVAGVACGLFFCLGGIFAAAIVEWLSLLPAAMIAVLAGLALLGAIQKSLTATMTGTAVPAGLLTFLVTMSDVQLFGIGAAFWGVAVGVGVERLTALAQRAAARG